MYHLHAGTETSTLGLPGFRPNSKYLTVGNLCSRKKGSFVLYRGGRIDHPIVLFSIARCLYQPQQTA